jgi:hypothetical protein
LNYARRQQYHRLSRAGAAAVASVAAALLALVLASVGAISLAGLLLLTAVPSASTRATGSVWPVAAGWARSRRTRCAVFSLRLRRRGGGSDTGSGGTAGETSTQLRSRPAGSASRSKRRRGATTIAISCGCASRPRGCPVAGEGGAGAARCQLLCVVRDRGVQRWEQGALVVSIDRLTSTLQSAAGGLGARSDSAETPPRHSTAKVGSCGPPVVPLELARQLMLRQQQ